jgi:hypothetical protein
MITSPTLMTAAYCDAIYAKYSIIGHLEFKQFDHDFNILEKHLQLIKKDQFSHNERIIIEHQDCDYYLKDFPYGIGLYNLFTVFKKIDIPLFTILLFTNHIGISREINALAPDVHDCPTVIESFITKTHYSNNYQPIQLEVDQIQRPGLCMLGQPRVHRHAMYHFLEKENLLPLVATSIQGPI